MAELAHVLPQSHRATVRLDRIEVKDRIRAVDPAWAAFIAADIEINGPVTPPELRPVTGLKLRLVHGAHRLAAYHLLGWQEAVFDIFDQDALSARAREIAENLVRRELSALDRAAFVAELYQVERARLGLDGAHDARVVGAKARWSRDAADTMSGAYRLQDQVAARVGFTSRTVRRDLELHRGLPPHVLRLIAGSAAAENAGQLRALLKLAPELQGRVAEAIHNGTAVSVTAALAQLQPKALPTPESKTWSAFIGAWGRMGARERRDALRHLSETGLPRGVEITFSKESADA